MHAYLVSQFIQPNTPDTLNIYPDPSIGIAEVRLIQNFLSRKPVQSGHNTVVINSAEKLTLPAQQAFLKTLEEPPGNSQIYLVTTTPHSLLPTVLSRVQVINSASSPQTYAIPDTVKEFVLAKVGERLQFFESQAFNRDSALEFLNHLEHLLHTNPSLQINYDLIYSTRTYLKANCNVKLTLDHLALNL